MTNTETLSGVTSLELLRTLRSQAEVLLANLKDDLDPFRHQDKLTFLRTPESPPITGDVNVTTTCSCVMALACTHQFREFYGADADAAAGRILAKLIKAPWMSSGLVLNNAFTTTLVLRTYGFLSEHQLLINEVPELEKKWALSFEVRNAKYVAEKLKRRDDDGLRFVYRSLSDNTRALLDKIPQDESKLRDALTSDLRRIMQSGWIYEELRFGKIEKKELEELEGQLNSYKVIEFNYRLLGRLFPNEVEPFEDRSFEYIADQMAQKAENFAINDYPPSAAVLYWFVEGVSRAKISLAPENWTTICKWAREEFNRQHSLVLSEKEPLMDPIAMGMSACLCARMRSISAELTLGMTKDHLPLLPSQVELEHAVLKLFALQPPSGIWPKYFAMFHYQDQGAGSNFCFAFELLEAILNEFGGSTSQLLENSNFIAGLQKAVKWCEANRFTAKVSPYEGWNSGGYITTLRKNQPESWATAVVHMFLYELTLVLCRYIQRRVLASYRTTSNEGRDDSRLQKMVDIEVLIPGEEKTRRLTEVLRTELIDRNTTRNEDTLRYGAPMVPTSALLFGPPGTSKTEVTRGVAEALGWSLLTITPSEFVRQGWNNVFLQADEVFKDVMDLSGVVVFFDEMDALMQSREEGKLDTTTQFLTTAMLPKLAELRKRGRVIFFMATNYQAKFDPAIKRAGRFDLLLCMGPPTWTEKIDNLKAFFPKKKLNPDQAIRARNALDEYLKDDPLLRDQLGLFTFAEFQSFLKTIGDESNLGMRIEGLGKDGFRSKARTYSKSVVLRLDDLPEKVDPKKIWDWDEFPREHKDEAVEKEIGRYLRDRKMSRIQYD